MSQQKDDYVEEHLDDALTERVESLSGADIREISIFHHDRMMTIGEILRDEFELRVRQELEEAYDEENKPEYKP